MFRKTIKFILFLSAILTGLNSHAQTDKANAEADFTDNGRGWVFGLNVGVYYPSRKTAAYYNGNSSNVNNVEYVMSNYYRYQSIFNALGAHDSVSVAGLPQKMHYKMAIQPGLYAQYCFSPTFALMIEFNYMKLKAEDVITFEVDPPLDYLANPDLRLYPMRGAEVRIYANIGLKRSYIQSDRLSYFWTGGLNVNSTQVKQCAFYVEDVEYSMVNVYLNGGYVPNGNSQTFNVYQGGIGLGGFAGAGLSLKPGNGMVVEPGITANLLMVKLENYQNMNPGIGVYVRFLF